MNGLDQGDVIVFLVMSVIFVLASTALASNAVTKKDDYDRAQRVWLAVLCGFGAIYCLAFAVSTKTYLALVEVIHTSCR